MGAFDEIFYRGKLYQTKSFDCPWQDQYDVRGDELWREEYDVEDRSDPNAKGLMRIVGMCTAVNKRWVRSDFTGTVYTWEGPTLTFDHGKLVNERTWNDEIRQEMDIHD